MLARSSYRPITFVIALVLLQAAGAASDGTSADECLALKRSLRATSPGLSAIKANLPSHVWKVVELAGMVKGVVRCGDSAGFILDCGGESVSVTAANPPACIAGGNAIRALVRVGPGCVFSLSDLRLEGAAWDHEVSAKEPKPSSGSRQVQSLNHEGEGRESSPKAFISARQARGMNLSSRAAQIYEPYKNAIAGFNRGLTDRQLDSITKSILAYSGKYGVDPRLVVALILVESGFRPDATSPKGAMGLGQLMPSTAKGLGVSDAYDPVQNIEASVRLMRGHLDKYQDLALALSAYNAGSGAVKKYNGVPPYRETKNYISKVSQTYSALCGR